MKLLLIICLFGLLSCDSCNSNTGQNTSITAQTGSDGVIENGKVFDSLPAIIETWKPPIPEYMRPAIQGFFLKDNQMVLYWNKIPEVTRYTVLYGNSKRYTHSVETTETVVIIPEIDSLKTWYFAVHAQKDTAISGILMDYTIQAMGQNSEVQVYDPTIFAAQKAAWEALNIRSYRFTAESRIAHPRIPFTITVKPHAEPKMEYDANRVNDPFFPGEIHNDTFYPFGPIKGKTFEEIFVSIPDHVAGNNNELLTMYIKYNETYHFVEYFRSRLHIPNIWGGWGGFHVYSFEVLED